MQGAINKLRNTLSGWLDGIIVVEEGEESIN